MEKEKMLSGNFFDDMRTLDNVLRVDENFDILKKEMQMGGAHQCFYYVDGFIKAEITQKLITHLLSVKDFGKGEKGDAERFAKASMPAVEIDTENRIEELTVAVLSGCTVMICDGFGADALVIDNRTYPARETSEPENDKVMRGSRDGFVETLIFNTAMLRRRIRNPMMTVEYARVGKSSKTDIALCYIKNRVDKKLLEKLRRKLDGITMDSVILGHESVVESIIRKGWWNPFPKVRLTERPDVAAASVLEGSVVLICDNSPEVMLFPTSVFDFLQEADDYYYPPLTGSYLRIIRQLVFWISIVATPLWYLALMYKDILPDRLLFLIPKESGAVPIFLQLLFTEFVIDGLKLASLNTPDMMSSSFSVVGGLLLGDFAVKVGWLCPDVILYMSFSAIANFTQSSYEIGYAFKFMRIITLILTALLGLWGFIAGFLFGILLLSLNKSFGGRSYLYPVIPFNGRALTRLLFRPLKYD